MENNVVLKIRSRLGEGIWWDDRRKCLFWVDIMKKEVHCLKDGQDRLLKTFDDFTGFCAPCEDGRLVVGCGRDLLLFDPDTLDTQVLQTVDEDETNNRFNDAKATPDGRIWAGTMNNRLNEEDVDDANTGRLYLLESGKEPIKLLDQLSVSNGIAFTADAKTVYHVDTYSQTIYAYDYDSATGLPSNPRVAVKVPVESGNPDGFTIAADGTLFVAHWGGSAIRRYDPATGEELGKWEFPAVHVTCCCFGGENLDELYVNTSSIDAPEAEYPLAGSIFMVKPGVKGMKVNRFKV
ncbi:MAG: SMP-30/gluconolactonase/LRE family protein [Oscillospiraceae bacterium]|nr:SMP-30/gluconolactonase/LRE family protein [Oscillospiraceae bacterium]